VTAVFNLNLLARTNRELGADFDLLQFADPAKSIMTYGASEMHLESKLWQIVNIPATEVSVEFQEGETIWTESSHKYSAEEIGETARDSGFRCETQWIDEQWPFSENLLIGGVSCISGRRSWRNRWLSRTLFQEAPELRHARRLTALITT